ncbi:MAG: hypothetical protein Q8R25_00590, partial [bacterium]|nr:hypothetical protein [bacterium]
MDEGGVWRKVNPGGETKKALERGEAAYGDLQSAEDLARGFETSRRKATRRLGVESLSKGPEAIEFVGLLQMFITEERKRLDLPDGFVLQTERIRLHDPLIWTKTGKTSLGEYRSAEDHVHVKGPEKQNALFSHFAALAHEVIHQASYFETDPVSSIATLRVGYQMQDGTGLGLDEAVTEMRTKEMLSAHSEILSDRFGQPYDRDGTLHRSWGDTTDAYGGFRDVVGAVITQVNSELYGGEPTIWDMLKRGQMAGDDAALRDIRKVLGVDSFRVFMAMGNTSSFDLKKVRNDFRNLNVTSDERAADVIFMWIHRLFTKKIPKGDSTDYFEHILRYLKVKDQPIDRVPDTISILI